MTFKSKNDCICRTRVVLGSQSRTETRPNAVTPSSMQSLIVKVTWCLFVGKVESPSWFRAAWNLETMLLSSFEHATRLQHFHVAIWFRAASCTQELMKIQPSCPIFGAGYQEQSVKALGRGFLWYGTHLCIVSRSQLSCKTIQSHATIRRSPLHELLLENTEKSCHYLGVRVTNPMKRKKILKQLVCHMLIVLDGSLMMSLVSTMAFLRS